MRTLKVTNLVTTIPTVSTNYDFECSADQCLSVQYVWASATASWTIALKTSNNGVDFTSLGSASTVANDSGSLHTQVAFVKDSKYVRVQCTKTSGTLTDLKVLVASQQRD